MALAVQSAEHSAVLFIERMVDPELQNVVLQGVAKYHRPVARRLSAQLG